MKMGWFLLLMVFFNGIISNGAGTNASLRPSVVNIGAILSFNSTIGKVAKFALDAAVQDVNSDPTVLGGTKLKLTTQDTNFSGFGAIMEALQFMEGDTVAIIGPQSSVTAHVVSHIANELQVPLLSYAATDPTLFSLQYPFFVMTTHSDLYQMAAIADLVDYHGWREVIAIYVDDDYGRNGIAALGDELANKRCKISYKAPMYPESSRNDITDVLVKVALPESRILVVHTYAEWGLEVLDVAQYLGMMGSGYVWIATNWLSTVMDTDAPLPSKAMNNIQGVLTLRMYTPPSELKSNFVSRWSKLTSAGTTHVELSAYGLYAYDTVWVLAHAINAFFNKEGTISFSNDTRLTKLKGGSLHLDAMSIFDGGNLLLQSILQVNMTGVTGPIKFNLDHSLIRPAYEVINVIGTGTRTIGYWSNYSGLSVVPPQTLYTKPPNRTSSNQRLYDAIWPGQVVQTPRGWAFPNNGRQLIIGVPDRVSFRQFISRVKGTDMFEGYCIDVFTAALSLLPYAVPYKLVPFGDGINNPRRTELVHLITTGVYDAAIGDIAIVTNRIRMVDFTQPYIESGLVVVAPIKTLNSNAMAFLKPFTTNMWIVTGVFFLLVGTVIWILKTKDDIFQDDIFPADIFRDDPRRRKLCTRYARCFCTTLWSIFLTAVFADKNNESALGRFVLIMWLCVALIVNSSYTASLTSILTVQQLSSPVKGIESLQTSNDPIGYQQGSFARNYLSEELRIHKSRLVPLNSEEDYAKALRDGPKKGGVAAVVDERAYMELFLSTRCEFTIVGQEFTKSGWGFAFPRDSPLAADMSTAILKLSETGELQRIHDKWLGGSACRSEDEKLEVDRLQLKSFWGLYVICGSACLVALVIYVIRLVRRFSKHSTEESDSSVQNSQPAWLQTCLSFVDEKEENVKSRSKIRQTETASTRSTYEDESMSSSKRRDIG